MSGRFLRQINIKISPNLTQQISTVQFHQISLIEIFRIESKIHQTKYFALIDIYQTLWPIQNLLNTQMVHSRCYLKVHVRKIGGENITLRIDHYTNREFFDGLLLLLKADFIKITLKRVVWLKRGINFVNSMRSSVILEEYFVFKGSIYT